LLDSLNVWLRRGCKPNAAHIRRIVVWEKPVSAAIERIDQCVVSAGVVRNFCSITAATDLLGKPFAHRRIARHRSDSDRAAR
jgi:hypothetical protein